MFICVWPGRIYLRKSLMWLLAGWVCSSLGRPRHRAAYNMASLWAQSNHDSSPVSEHQGWKLQTFTTWSQTWHTITSAVVYWLPRPNPLLVVGDCARCEGQKARIIRGLLGLWLLKCETHQICLNPWVRNNSKKPKSKKTSWSPEDASQPYIILRTGEMKEPSFSIWAITRVFSKQGRRVKDSSYKIISANEMKW